jgi:hypothetical protein
VSIQFMVLPSLTGTGQGYLISPPSVLFTALALS